VGGGRGKKKYPSSYKMPRVEEAERKFVFQGLVQFGGTVTKCTAYYVLELLPGREYWIYEMTMKFI
jgi:hypothetical protein